ncbi:MAG: glycoside hydrolase family 127 protein [Bacteroidales bacterium]|nr:glycoside hydrolase family 127 protein [Bacteroidales bacterium]
MKNKGLTITLLSFFILVSCRNDSGITSSTGINTMNYQGNRAPLRENPFIELPLGSVKAKGWLEEMLIRQKDGATGHLDDLYPLVMGENNGWLGGDGDQWERGPYWIHGLVTLAYTLDDPDLINKTKPWIEWIFKSQRPDGFFGPDTDYKNIPGVNRENAADWWPRMVVLKILKQYYSATGDDRVIELMSAYFRYQLEKLPLQPLNNWTFWARFRGGDNLMVVYWLYNITGEEFLLDLAEIIHEQTFDYTHRFLNTGMIASQENIHCVNLAQGIKEPVVYYQQHPDEKYLNSVKKAFQDLRNFSGQPQGMFGGDEALRNGIPTHGVELCSVVEMMFSLETILAITGEVQFADHLERIAYNALPAQITDDFMNRQYFQQANQVLVTRHDRDFSINHQGTDLCFGFLTGYPCCTSNMHQGWPIFTQNLWFATPDGGVAALVYGPSELTARVADGREIRITEETSYPFEDVIRFTLKSKDKDSIKFPLKVRIPAWSKEAEISINGAVYANPPAGEVFTIEREWLDGDVVVLAIPSEIELNRWHERSVSVDRGPLNFVLKIGENWKKVENKKDPQSYGDSYYEVYPSTPWNYGLIDIPAEEIRNSYRIRRKEDVQQFPWNSDNAPIEIEVKAIQLPNWTLYNGSAGPLPYSVQWGVVTGEEKTLTLIPYGCSTLRISAFPLVGTYSVMH